MNEDVFEGMPVDPRHCGHDHKLSDDKVAMLEKGDRLKREYLERLPDHWNGITVRNYDEYLQVLERLVPLPPCRCDDESCPQGKDMVVLPGVGGIHVNMETGQMFVAHDMEGGMTMLEETSHEEIRTAAVCMMLMADIAFVREQEETG